MDKEIFYLKVNRYEGYTIRNMKRWLEIIREYECSQIYIVCDREDLKKWILETCNFDGLSYEFIGSRIDNDELKYIISKVTGGELWEKPGYSHLTTFLHAKENRFEEYWNIDADDTKFVLSPKRTKELLECVKDYAVQNEILLLSLDMHASKAASGKHWSFGITYTDNKVDWMGIMKTHCESFDVPDDDSINVDRFFRYLKNNTELKIEGFYAENLRFIHYSNDFFFRAPVSGFYHWTNGKLVFPILKDCFGLEKAGCVDIDPSLIRFDIGITNEETTEDMMISCSMPEYYKKYV